MRAWTFSHKQVVLQLRVRTCYMLSSQSFYCCPVSTEYMFAAQQYLCSSEIIWSVSVAQLKYSMFLSVQDTKGDTKSRVLKPRVTPDLGWEQVTLPQLVVQLHSLFKQRVFLLTQVGDLLANLLWVLSAAAAKKTIPLTQLSLKWLNAPCKCHQVFTQGLEGRQRIHFEVFASVMCLPTELFVVVNTWLERSLLVSRPLRSCSRASFLARISSRLVSSPSRSSSPLLCSSTRSISSSSQRFCSSIFCSHIMQE